MQQGLKFKYLLLTQQIISKQGIINLTTEINQHNNNSKEFVKIMPKCLEQNQSYELRLAILIQNNLNFLDKIKSCQTVMKWIICTDSDSNLLNNKEDVQGVLILSQQNQQDIHCMNVSFDKFFVIRTIKQALKIVAMPSQQLQKREKMQKMLRKSQNKYKINRVIYQFKSFVNKLVDYEVHAQIKTLSLGLSFYGLKRLRMMRKYFTEWTISHYEKLIQKQQFQIIKGNYLIEASNKKLLLKCFNSWKELKSYRKY